MFYESSDPGTEIYLLLEEGMKWGVRCTPEQLGHGSAPRRGYFYVPYVNRYRIFIRRDEFSGV